VDPELEPGPELVPEACPFPPGVRVYSRQDPKSGGFQVWIFGPPGKDYRGAVEAVLRSELVRLPCPVRLTRVETTAADLEAGRSLLLVHLLPV
jgi:hypothetical protein